LIRKAKPVRRGRKAAAKAAPKTVSQYISAHPKNVREILKKIRATILDAAPNAEESISYGIPTFKIDGARIYFAAFKDHIGIYPVTPDVKAKLKELSRYKGGKGTVQLPLDEPIPYALIRRIVKLKIQQKKAR
jgi:uncharacterized protein YdhG (YjbR/CyaY superfamily)